MLEIKNEISDTINKITEHLEFLGYKIEKDKEDKELLLAVRFTDIIPIVRTKTTVFDT